jgi:hypothetical protein
MQRVGKVRAILVEPEISVVATSKLFADISLRRIARLSQVVSLSIELFGGDRQVRFRFMEDDAFDRVKVAFPWRALERVHGGLISRVPAGGDSVGREVDVLGVVLIVNARHQQADNMHLRDAAVAGQLAHYLAISLFGRYLLHQLTDDVAQAVALLLASDMARDATRVLNVFLPVKNLPYRARHRPSRVPQVNGKDK